jgi:hypothetical protein
MIKFIKDVNLGKATNGDDCIIKAGMVASFCRGCFDITAAGTITRGNAIAFSLARHPEWNEFLNVPTGAMAIFDFDERIVTKDCYKITPDKWYKGE